MRAPLTLLPTLLMVLLVLLMQPLALMHGLSHGGAAAPAAATQTDAASVAEAGDAAEHSTCLHCLALGALALALPATAVFLTLLRLQPVRPERLPALRGGGTAAGFHARGPPLLLH